MLECRRHVTFIDRDSPHYTSSPIYGRQKKHRTPAGVPILFGCFGIYKRCAATRRDFKEFDVDC